jgi:hypothetical protein
MLTSNIGILEDFKDSEHPASTKNLHVNVRCGIQYAELIYCRKA